MEEKNNNPLKNFIAIFFETEKLPVNESGQTNHTCSGYSSPIKIKKAAGKNLTCRQN
jgi:hypothetical protein